MVPSARICNSALVLSYMNTNGPPEKGSNNANGSELCKLTTVPRSVEAHGSVVG
jgi:hypothetical protein